MAQTEDLIAFAAKTQADLQSTTTLICGFLKSILGKDVQPDKIPETLFDLAQTWRTVGASITALDTSRNLTPELDILRARVKIAYAAEDIELVWELLSEVERREESVLAKLEAHHRDVAQELAQRRDELIATKRSKQLVAEAQLKATEVATLIIQRIALETNHQFPIGAILVEHERLLRRGMASGRRINVEIALELVRSVESKVEPPNDQISVQIREGITLASLGRFWTGLRDFESGIETQRLALRQIVSLSDPEFYSSTANNLAVSLREFARQAQKVNCLFEAIHLLLLANHVRSFALHPGPWHETQKNLANCYDDLGMHMLNVGWLRIAVSTFRDSIALGLEDPSRSAKFKHNLGLSLTNLGCVLRDANTLSESVREIDSAIRIYINLAEPLEESVCSLNIGGAYLALVEIAGEEKYTRLAYSNTTSALNFFQANELTGYIQMAMNQLERIRQLSRAK